MKPQQLTRTHTIRIPDETYDQLISLSDAAEISENRLVGIVLTRSFARPNFLEIVNAAKPISRSQPLIAS